MDDIALFSKLPNLVSLEILGTVDAQSHQEVSWKNPTLTLRRLWAPTTAFTLHQLGLLTQECNLTALAFTFDAECVLDEFDEPPSSEEILDTLEELKALFGAIGPQLKELSIMSPFADGRDTGMGALGFPNFMNTIALGKSSQSSSGKTTRLVLR
jgi:hypothetical protein